MKRSTYHYGSSNQRYRFLSGTRFRYPVGLLTIIIAVAGYQLRSLGFHCVDAFSLFSNGIKTKISPPTTAYNTKINSIDYFALQERKTSKGIPLLLSNKNNNNEDDFDWIGSRIDRADPVEIRNDVTLLAC